MATIIYVESEATGRLSELGVSSSLIREAVLGGELARDGCTPNDPPILRGIVAWARTIRTLRELLGAAGWRRDDKDNFSTVVHPDGQLAIAVAAGDDQTGNPAATSKTRHPKGGVTEAAVENNQQLSLFALTELAPPKKLRATWILLVHRKEGFLHTELSLPSAIGDDGRVDAWSERIILEPIGSASDLIDIPEAPPAIEIAVTRKSG
ncbi:MAG TPA: hypothetical protein PKI03_32530 [Pseudomonadota bacterium]|nr:hypothetical protein [Pseudomonadota bacterium]